MKKNSNVLIILMLATFVFQINANAQEFKKYYQKSGKLVQKLTGSATGTQTIIWDDYGNKELTMSDMSMMGMSQKQSSLIIGKDMYSWNSMEPTVAHMQNGIAEEYQKRNYTADDFAQLANEMMEQSGFVKKDNETLMGKECTVWENSQGIKVWGWKNLTLQMTMNAMGMSLKYEPVSLDLDINIPAGTFDLPKDKTVEDKTDEKKEAENKKMIELMDNMSKTGTNN